MRVPYARPGAVIDVVAPASACRPAELAAGAAVLEGWGLRPRIPANLFQRAGGAIVAAPDEARHRMLRRALLRPDSTVVWCARGGYGSQRLLPRLARGAPPARPKLLVGFSDATALHVFVNQHWGWPSLHAATLADLGSGRLAARSVRELRAVVTGAATRFECALRPLNDAARRARTVEAGLAGGNLKTLQSLAGTPWAVRGAGRIVVVEDAGERGYAIDRMLVQLVQSGALRGVRALVFGQFTGGREADGRFTGAGVMARFARAVRFPVLAGAPAGHGDTARALPLGPGPRARLALGPARARLALTWELAGR